MLRVLTHRWLMALLLFACTVGGVKATVGDKFARLDSLIAAQPQLVADKEKQLVAMKQQLGKAQAPNERYAIFKALYEQYSAYQYDSAYACVAQCIRLAESMGAVRLLNESRLNLAHILSTACLMDKAQQTVVRMNPCDRHQ